MLTTLTRRLALILACTVIVAACGSDDDADNAVDDTTTTTTVDDTTTTAPATTETTGDDGTTTTAPDEIVGGVIAEGSVTTAEGLTSEWTLTADETSLCFEATLAHDDPDIATSAGSGVADCLEPDGGLDEMESGLSVDVGTVDGEKTIGFLWGRVAPEVTILTIEHADGTQTPIDIIDGPTEVSLFAYVVEVESIPPVQDLDAASGTEIEASAPIRDFLRAGPTYPVVTTPPTTTSPDYPTG